MKIQNGSGNRPATMSQAETARLLGCSPRTVREAIEKGELPAIRLNGRVRVIRAGVERLLQVGDQAVANTGGA